MSTLEITIGEPIDGILERWGGILNSALKGGGVTPYFGVGFTTMAQFGAAFTPKRWELVEELKTTGPLTMDALD